MKSKKKTPKKYGYGWIPDFPDHRDFLFIFLAFILSSLLPIQSAYAGKIIDKSKEGYFLSLPKPEKSGEKNPVLVCLPGWGISAKQDVNVWSFPANKAGFFVIDMDINYNLIKKDQDVENIYRQINAIVNSLSTIYPIKTDKIYITGTSAGGEMSLSLALRHPERFSAAGVVSGGVLWFGAGYHLKQAKGSLIYMIHGRGDKIFPIEKFYTTKKQLEENGALVQFKVIPDGGHTLRSGEYIGLIDWLAKVGTSAQKTDPSL